MKKPGTAKTAWVRAQVQCMGERVHMGQPAEWDASFQPFKVNSLPRPRRPGRRLGGRRCWERRLMGVVPCLATDLAHLFLNSTILCMNVGLSSPSHGVPQP